MREKILQLRKEGKTYKQIMDVLQCSKGLVYYYINPNEKEKIRLRTLVLRYNKRKKYKMLAGGKCKKCGYSKCLDSVCFHHRDPSTKEFEIGTAIMNGNVSESKLRKEIKKCDLVCLNCHGELHSHEQDYQSLSTFENIFIT